MQILPIPGRELYNATLRNYIIEAKFQNKFIKKFAPKNVKVARAHGLLKDHNFFERVPSFRLIIDTVDSTH